MWPTIVDYHSRGPPVAGFVTTAPSRREPEMGGHPPGAPVPEGLIELGVVRRQPGLVR